MEAAPKPSGPGSTEVSDVFTWDPRRDPGQHTDRVDTVCNQPQEEGVPQSSPASLPGGRGGRKGESEGGMKCVLAAGSAPAAGAQSGW